MQLCLFFLTCADQTQADSIATVLLEKRLVACVKMMPVNSKFMWNGSLDTAHEILLIMDGVRDNFSSIEQEVRAIHSYETFVLVATAIQDASAGVPSWICESIQINKT